MGRQKQLTKRQLAVIEDLFSGELNEQGVLDKHKISRNIYNKWQTDESFAGEFARRIDGACRQGQLIIARYASLAAAKLVALTESENQETARKACLDIISLPKWPAKEGGQGGKTSSPDPGGGSETAGRQLSAETAGKLLAALAKSEKPETKSQKP
jgi:hypothetical protein